MISPMPSMFLRIITGIVLLAVLGTALACGGVVLTGLFVLISVLAMWEFYALFWKSREHLLGRILAVILGAGILIGTWSFPQVSAYAMLPVVLLLLCLFLFAWGTGRDISFTDTALLLAGVCYVPLLLFPVLTLSIHEQIFLLGVPIVSDSVAYFAGVRFGRHKIWPRVSPKKSVEGAAAGLLGSVLWAVCLGAVWGTAPLWLCAAAGSVLGVFSQLGDFFESAVKRVCNVKDSGTLLPGHGGVLDRIDSLLFVTPAYGFMKVFFQLF